MSKRQGLLPDPVKRDRLPRSQHFGDDNCQVILQRRALGKCADTVQDRVDDLLGRLVAVRMNQTDAAIFTKEHPVPRVHVKQPVGRD